MPSSRCGVELANTFVRRGDMSKNDNRTPPKRQYPPVYERVVPIALGIIALAVVVILIIIIGVALGFFPSGG